MDIPERLKEERKRLGLSQSGFGALGGAGKTTVISWERGDATPNAAFLAAVGTAGADVQYIVTGIRSDAALSPDERELIALYRAAPLAGKMAAVGALQGALGAGVKQKIGGSVGGHVIAGNVTESELNISRKKK